MPPSGCYHYHGNVQIHIYLWFSSVVHLTVHRMGQAAVRCPQQMATGQCRQPKNLGLFLMPGRQGIGGGQSWLTRHRLSAALDQQMASPSDTVLAKLKEVRVPKLVKSLWGQSNMMKAVEIYQKVFKKKKTNPNNPPSHTHKTPNPPKQNKKTTQPTKKPQC